MVESVADVRSLPVLSQITCFFLRINSGLLSMSLYFVIFCSLAPFTESEVLNLYLMVSKGCLGDKSCQKVDIRF